MKSNRLFRLVLPALVISVLSTGAYIALGLVLSGAMAFKITVAMIAGAWGATLLAASGVATGRVVVSAVWLTVTIASALTLGAPAFALLQIGMIWLLRALYLHPRVLAALLDLALTGCATGAAVWAAETGSFFLMVWSFLLVQSVTLLHSTETAEVTADADDFDRAREEAQAALKILLHR